MANSETKRAIELPKDLCFAGSYSCENCTYSGAWYGNQIECTKYSEYYSPNTANNCNAYHDKNW